MGVWVYFHPVDNGLLNSMPFLSISSNCAGSLRQFQSRGQNLKLTNLVFIKASNSFSLTTIEYQVNYALCYPSVIRTQKNNHHRNFTTMMTVKATSFINLFPIWSQAASALSTTVFVNLPTRL